MLPLLLFGDAVVAGPRRPHKLPKETAEIMVEWPAGGVDFEWDEANTKEAYEKAGNYIQKWNCLAGLKVDPASTPESTTLYITVPRWLEGVASTLNSITVNLNNVTEAPKLKPWPDWETNYQYTQNADKSCDSLQYVQSMEIDRNGLMWVIDVGRLNLFQAGKVDNTCPPKLLVFNTMTGKQVDEPFVFPEEVVSRTASFLNDIVIDTDRNLAYISDTGTNGGHIYMYNRTARRAFRFTDPSTMNGNPNLNWTFVNDGYGALSYADPLWQHAPEDGIALSPGGDYLYYSPLTAEWYNTVPTASIWERTKYNKWTVGTEGIEKIITGPTSKAAPSDGMTTGCDGTLFYGGLTSASVYLRSGPPFAVDSNPERLFANDDRDSQWPDTFAWGPDDAIWWSSNQLNVLFGTVTSGLGSAGPLHLWRHPKSRVVRGSYIKGPCGKEEEELEAPAECCIDDGRCHSLQDCSSECGVSSSCCC